MATVFQKLCIRQLHLISIHTTLAGGDKRTAAWKAPWKISIHTTLAGGDLSSPTDKSIKSVISIHTTLAGGDSSASIYVTIGDGFQSTPPSRVATPEHWQMVVSKDKFQSTPPSRVATNQIIQKLFQLLHFNPHHPRGWRPYRIGWVGY